MFKYRLKVGCRIIEIVSFELGKGTEKHVFRLVTSVGQRKISESPCGIKPQTSFDLFHSIHKNDAIDIANLSMQAACHMNFVIGLAHRRVSVAQW